MDSITVGWKKRLSNEVQFISHKQDKIIKKKVQFNCPSPIDKHQAFERTKLNDSEINHGSKFSFEDNNDISSSTNIFPSKSTITKDETMCSARAIVITFIIIVLIIVIVAIAIGVIFGTIKMGQNGTGNTGQYSLLTTVSTTVLTSSISIGSQSGPPCLSYTTINDPSRNILNNNLHRTCDNGPLFNSSNNGAWIRFVGSGGTIMAFSPPEKNHCGGYVAIWFNGTLPTVIGTMVNGSLCYNSDGFNCLVVYDTSVAYCAGGFYVYFLQPARFCNARYCTT